MGKVVYEISKGELEDLGFKADAGYPGIWNFEHKRADGAVITATLVEPNWGYTFFISVRKEGKTIEDREPVYIKNIHEVESVIKEYSKEISI